MGTLATASARALNSKSTGDSRMGHASRALNQLARALCVDTLPASPFLGANFFGGEACSFSSAVIRLLLRVVFFALVLAGLFLVRVDLPVFLFFFLAIFLVLSLGACPCLISNLWQNYRTRRRTE
jgi:hypothetical protein